MALVTSKEMFEKAYAGGYAIGAFNVNNMEIVQGITEACQEEHAPVILLAGLSDALHDLHVVDVERADGVAAVIRLLEHFSGCYERHNIFSFDKKLFQMFGTFGTNCIVTQKFDFARGFAIFLKKGDKTDSLCLLSLLN